MVCILCVHVWLSYFSAKKELIIRTVCILFAHIWLTICLVISVRKSADCFLIPQTTKSYVLNSFSWNTPAHWNKLSLEIRQSSSHNQFMKGLHFNLRKEFPSSHPVLIQLYNSMLGTSSVQHSRMRMGLKVL